MRAPDTDYETTQTPELRVEPGAAVRLLVRVHNLSVDTEVLHLVVEGVPDGWADIYPDRVELASDQRHEAEVTVHFPQTRTETWPIRVVVQARGRRVASAAAVARIAPRPVVARRARSGRAAHQPPRAQPRSGSPTPATAPADVALVARDGDGRLGLPPGSGARVHVPAGGRDARRRSRSPRRAARWSRSGALPVDGRGAGGCEPGDRARNLPTALHAAALGARRAGAGVCRRRVDGDPANEVAVPHVTGMSVSEARAKLAQAGLVGRLAAMPAKDAAHPETGVVAQEPGPGKEVPNGDDVTISYETGGGVATVTPKVDASSVAPPPGGFGATRLRARDPHRRPLPRRGRATIGGTVGDVSTDPTWNPATGELAYVRRRSASSRPRSSPSTRARPVRPPADHARALLHQPRVLAQRQPPGADRRRRLRLRRLALRRRVAGH